MGVRRLLGPLAGSLVPPLVAVAAAVGAGVLRPEPEPVLRHSGRSGPGLVGGSAGHSAGLPVEQGPVLWVGCSCWFSDKRKKC